MFIPPVVIDTNIFVGAAFNPDSASGRIIDAVRDQQLRLVWNDDTRTETMSVLSTIPPIDEQQFADLFDEAGHYSGPTDPQRFEVIADATDRKFAALAAAGSTVVVSNDSDLLDVRAQLPVAVQRPSQFVDYCGVFSN